MLGRSKAPPAPLTPSPIPLGISPHFTQHQQEIVFKLSEQGMRSWSSEDFLIRDPWENVQFRVDAKCFSLRHRRDFYDARNTPLFVVQKKIMSFFDTYEAYPFQNVGEDSLRLFSVKQKWALGGTKMTVTFANLAHDGREVTLQIKGSFFERSADITYEGVVVARVSRQWWNAQQFFLDSSTYYLSVAAGVDASLMIACVICLAAHDERKD